MLNSDVVSFIKVSLADQSLQAKQKSLDLEGLVALARSLGYRFTADDFQSTVSALASNELSEEELEQVAGGHGIGGGSGMPISLTPSNQQLITTLYGEFLNRP